MKGLVTGLVIVGVIVLVLLGISYISYRIAFYSVTGHDDPYDIPTGEQYEPYREVMTGLIDELNALEYERVQTTSHDGLKLSARYYHVQDGAPVKLEMHGYRGSGIRDFCGGNEIGRDAGWNILLVDQRAHGMSEGKAITFGVKERYDCLAWINYVAERFGPETKILLSGVSMGAATVLMASELPLPESVAGIVADCPYSSPEAIIKKVCRDIKLPAGVMYPFVWLGALLFAGFRLDEASAVEAVKKCKVPVFLIHGEDDRFVPCEMSREICAACASEVTFFTVPGAGHGLSYLVDMKGYQERTRAFARKIGLME